MQCSDFSLEQHEDTDGSAPSWDRMLIFTLASPWASKIENSLYFPEKLRMLMKNKVNIEGLRIQCIFPDDDYAQNGISKVLFYQKSINNGYVNDYNKTEFDIPISELKVMIAELING